MQVKRERVEQAASDLRDLLATRPVGPHLLTVSFTDNPARLFVYVKAHGFARDVPDRYKNLPVEIHYARTAPR